MSERKTIKVKQIRSGIGCPREMRETLKALGLGKMHRVAERLDTKETRGMIAKIPHLVQVVE
jgi:large subunit ribosomal protein L30